MPVLVVRGARSLRTQRDLVERRAARRRRLRRSVLAAARRGRTRRAMERPPLRGRRSRDGSGARAVRSSTLRSAWAPGAAASRSSRRPPGDRVGNGRASPAVRSGAGRLGRLRLFRYEVRCRRDGVIPDVGSTAAALFRNACRTTPASRAACSRSRRRRRHRSGGATELSGRGDVDVERARRVGARPRGDPGAAEVDPAGGRGAGLGGRCQRGDVGTVLEQALRRGRSGRARRGSRAGASA